METFGTMEAWVGLDGKLIEDPEAANGHFYSGESYIFLYTYPNKNAIRYQIYLWQGLHCSKQDRGLVALSIKDIVSKVRKEKGAEPNHERLVQFKETDQFLTAFKGKMIVHLGRKKNFVANESEFHLYQVKEYQNPLLKAFEINYNSATPLINSKDVFFVQNTAKQIVWIGSGMSDDAKQKAIEIANNSAGDRAVTLINEGENDKSFWDLIGGKRDYLTSSHLKKQGWKPRLFQCSMSTGTFISDPLFDFAQSDLDNFPSDAFILDIVSEVFVWLAPKVSEDVKRKAMETATVRFF